MESTDSQRPAKRESLTWAGLALLANLTAFFFWGGLVLLVAGFLYRAQRGLSPGRRVALCAAWGLLYSLIFYSWALYYGWLPWLALGLVRGLPWALFPLPSVLLERRWPAAGSAGHAFAGGSGYALVSLVLLLGITGADWETPLAALIAWPWLLVFLPWVGLVGGSFFLGALSVLLGSGRKAGMGVGAALSFALALLSATLFMNSPDRLPKVPVALLQTGWTQDVKWDEDNVAQAQVRLFEMTEEAAAAGAQLVVWPETAWPVRGMRQRMTDTRKIGRLARALEVELLVSSIEEVPEGWYNSVSQVLPTGAFATEYRKKRLAPFAEYIPLSAGLQNTLREMAPFASISPYLPGDQENRFSGGASYAVLVCYESMIPGPAAEAGAVDFLVVVTNDAPFRVEWAKEAHFRSAILRAIETRLPVLQAANTGVSGVISSRGVVFARSEPGYSGPLVKLAAPHGPPDG
ncbi:MAG: apolipoprotein N-acyltransferase [Vulcanimicrobiota bacterium]